MTPEECSDISTDSCGEDERHHNIRKSKYTTAIKTRPHASGGFWLSCLLPLALSSYYICNNGNIARCNSSTNYQMLTIASVGMCVESLCFFMYMFLDSALLVKLLISFVPAIITMGLFLVFMQLSLALGICWGFAVTFCYQNVYIRVMSGLPCCFTYGEAAVLVQGLMLFVLSAILQVLQWWSSAAIMTEFIQINAIMVNALFCLLVVCGLLVAFKMLRNIIVFYALMVLLVIAVTCIPVTNPIPVVALYNFIVRDKKRIIIIMFCFALVGLTIGTVRWQLQNTEKASTSVRKIFHLLIVLVYVPGVIYQCTFLYIASGVALAFFTVLELFRLLEVPPLGEALKSAFASFSDDKDAGMLALTPFCLLIGCSLPIWIRPCPCVGSNNNHAEMNLLALLSGVLAIGFGDTAASVIGSKYGYIKWHNSSRSLQGTTAYIAAIMLALLAFNISGYILMSASQWIITIAATLITALIEAHTDQIDNLVLPLVFYIIVNFAY